MPTNLMIYLDNSSGVFFAGQTVTGRVSVSCTEEKKCREITVEFLGFSKVHWSESRNQRRNSKTQSVTVHYRSHEEYYRACYRLWGTGQEAILPPGTYEFPFSFVLPQHIPYSFESHIGQVRHVCSAKMNVPWGFDKGVHALYSVNSLLDLNAESIARVPIEGNDHKFLCCLWCRSGPLSMVLRIPRSGYVPGEKIVLNAECSNKTNSEVKYTEASIHQVVTYYAQGSRKVHHMKVAELFHPKIAPGDDDIWASEEFTVPALPPSRLANCHNIDIEYVFKFKMSVSGCHTSLECAAPLIIGSIPLREMFTYFAPATGFAPQPSASGYAPQPGPMMPQPPPGAPPMPSGFGGDYGGGMNPSAPYFPGLEQYPDLPPPTYAESVFGATNVEDNEGNGEGGGVFAPKYASYSLFAAPPPYNESIAQSAQASGEEKNIPQ